MSVDATRQRLGKACVYIGDSECPFLVAETPREVAALVMDQRGLIELTLANDAPWNGKPVFVRADRVVAITPPKDTEDDE